MFDGKAFGREIVAQVKAHVTAALDPILKRLDKLESLHPLKGEAGPQGNPGADGLSVKGFLRDADDHLVVTMADGSTRDLGKFVGENGRDGKDGVPGAPGIAGKDGVQGEKGEAGPHGEKGEPGINGKDGSNGADGKDGAAGEPGCDGEDGLPGEAGKDGAAGKDADPEVVAAIVHRKLTANFDELRQELEARVAAIPLPKDGAAGLNGKDGAPGERGQNGEPGKDGMPGKDGADGKDGIKGDPGRDGKDGRDGLDVKDLFIVENGDLISTFSDGRSKNLGPFRGKDGENGTAGEPGKDGVDGKNGEDGLGFDDLELVHDGEREVTFRFVRGQKLKEFQITLPLVIDRGVWEFGKTYSKGDGATAGGSYWIATEDTREKPGSGKGWRLAVKRGRDAKEPVKLKAEAE